MVSGSIEIRKAKNENREIGAEERLLILGQKVEDVGNGKEE